MPEVLSFSVVGVDGLPVVEPYVLVRPDGYGMRTYQFRGTADGQVNVTLPDDDPAVVARSAAGMPVNVTILVTAQEPLAGRSLDTAAIVAALNVHGASPILPFDVADVGKRVYVLQPGSPETEAYADEDPPDDPDCPGDIGASSLCYIEDWPANARTTLVPLAENFGAGRDMVASMQYETTEVTTTTVALNVGVSGFYEAGGGQAYKDSNVRNVDFGSVGPKANMRVYLETAFMRIREGMCYTKYHGPGGTDPQRHCRLVSKYVPDYATGGSRGETAGHLNDTLDAAVDCKTPVLRAFSDGKGTLRGSYFRFALGPSEDWATGPGFEAGGLHAQTIVTSEVESAKDHVRTWTVVDNPQFKEHYMMVKGGLASYNRFERGGGIGNCPDNAVAEAWTHAMTTPSKLPVAPVNEPPSVRYCDPPSHDAMIEECA